MITAISTTAECNWTWTGLDTPLLLCLDTPVIFAVHTFPKPQLLQKWQKHCINPFKPNSTTVTIFPFHYVFYFHAPALIISEPEMHNIISHLLLRYYEVTVTEVWWYSCHLLTQMTQVNSSPHYVTAVTLIHISHNVITFWMHQEVSNDYTAYLTETRNRPVCWHKLCEKKQQGTYMS